MVENPNVQARAQAELDAVVGRERLPTFEDRPNLPYLNALVLEVLRWKFMWVLISIGIFRRDSDCDALSTPMGMPHATIQDDEYKWVRSPAVRRTRTHGQRSGYHIPAGSILLANSWWFMHDPEVFDDPEAFIPERFLRKAADGSWEPNPDAPDPRTVLFGYGRRCVFPLPPLPRVPC
jgi:cytochrome P450